MPTMTFRSKVDIWLAVVVLIAALSALVGVLYAGRSDPRIWPVGLVMVVVSLGLPAWIFPNTRYDLDDHTLHIRSAPFGWHIPVADVSAITETRNPLSSPALSLS